MINSESLKTFVAPEFGEQELKINVDEVNKAINEEKKIMI